MSNDQKPISRKQFLAILGGATLSFVVAKVSSTSAPLKSLGLIKKSSPSAYGNSAYGGKTS